MLARMQRQWLPLLLVLCLFALMISLSFWQLGRYFEKQTLVNQFKILSHNPPLAWSKLLQTAQKEFRQVSVQGRFLGQSTLLLDNRWNHKQLGYEVLTPFQIKSTGTLLLVNRGWIARADLASGLSLLEPSVVTQAITGYLKKPSVRGLVLGENIQNYADGFPRIQKINLTDVSHYLHEPLYPYVLRLAPSAPQGFVRHWKLVIGKPAKHLGYAMQWFLMALVLLIAYYFFARRHQPLKKEHSDGRK